MVQSWLKAVHVDDPIQQRLAPMVQVLSLLAMLAAAMAGALVLSSNMLLPVRIAGATGCGFVMLGALLSVVLVRAGYFNRAITTWNLLASCGLFQGLLSAGFGNGGVVVFGFSLLILYAGLLGSRRSLLATSGLCMVMGLAVFMLEPLLQPVMGFASLPTEPTFLGLYLIELFLLTIFVDTFSTTMKRALHESLDRARELERLRDLLEDMVEWRTRDLRESEARQRAMIEAIPDMICRINREGTVLDYHAEKSFPSIAPHDAIVGRSVHSLMPPGLARRIVEVAAHIVGTDEIVQREFVLTIDGAQVDREVRMVACGQDEVLCIVRDITERKRVDRMKNEFVSVVSHELRTPLTAIRGAIGLVAGGVAGHVDPAASDMLKIALKNSERLMRLINDILDIDKIESGKMPFDLRPQALAPLIEQALDANIGYGAQFGVSLAIAGPLPDVAVMVDSDRLQQVLANLISNAIKFSPAGECVLVSAAQEGGVVRVAIADHGAGIPEAFYKRVFQKFAQADSSDQRQRGGTGLGLSISKAIIERCGGTIGFTSALGQGTTFYFELPVIDMPADMHDMVSASSGRGVES